MIGELRQLGAMKVTTSDHGTVCVSYNLPDLREALDKCEYRFEK